MSKNTQPDGTKNTEVKEDAPTIAAEPTEVDPLVAMQSELDASREQTLRLAAELENLRKRSERDVADARRYGVARFAEDILSVADNLSRALDNVPEEARHEASQRMAQLVEGIDMTKKSLQVALERHGIKEIKARGEKFDHHVHQAVAKIPSTEFASGMVAEVIQPGYVIGDRTLRAAMVAVSTGPVPASNPSAPLSHPDVAPGSNVDTKA